MIEDVICPICGNKTVVNTDYINGCQCEYHFYCDKCGFIEEMAYSPSVISFDKGALCFNLKFMWYRLKNLNNFLTAITMTDYNNKLWRNI